MRKLCYFIFSLSIFLIAFQRSASAQQPAFRVLVVVSLAKDHVKMIDSAKGYLEKIAAENNFQLDFTRDSSQINDSNLANYQVFIPLHLAPFDMSYQQQAAVEKFVEGGGGWVGIHAAGLSGKRFLRPGMIYWQWFEDFMGGVSYSPHPAFQKGRLMIEDRNHPVTRNLPASFELGDEWYEFDKSPRGNAHILATADESSYHQNKPMGDHPLIWVNEKYRRMVYIGIGHDPSVWTLPEFETLIRDAILWAASK
ncbi:MAG: hypothetical protein C5B59_15185 [Bacteroidetes bacterium]|nr:MAG: hypothetical protein C5B59_15185 [Bacteroidota bacterium]